MELSADAKDWLFANILTFLTDMHPCINEQRMDKICIVQLYGKTTRSYASSTHFLRVKVLCSLKRLLDLCGVHANALGTVSFTTSLPRFSQ